MNWSCMKITSKIAIILHGSHFTSAVDHSTILPNLTSITSQNSNLAHIHHCWSKLASPKEWVLYILEHLHSGLLVRYQGLIWRKQPSIRHHAFVVWCVGKSRAGVHRHHQICISTLWALLLEFACIIRIQCWVYARVWVEIIEPVTERCAMGPPQRVCSCTYIIRKVHFLFHFTSSIYMHLCFWKSWWL